MYYIIELAHRSCRSFLEVTVFPVHVTQQQFYCDNAEHIQMLRASKDI